MLQTYQYHNHFVSENHNSQVESHWFLFPSIFPPVNSFIASYVPKCTACAGPAPIMTDETPRQRALIPSVEDILVNAFPIPVYTAAGLVANTCIRVWIVIDENR